MNSSCAGPLPKNWILAQQQFLSCCIISRGVFQTWSTGSPRSVTRLTLCFGRFEFSQSLELHSPAKRFKSVLPPAFKMYFLKWIFFQVQLSKANTWWNSRGEPDVNPFQTVSKSAWTCHSLDWYLHCIHVHVGFSLISYFWWLAIQLGIFHQIISGIKIGQPGGAIAFQLVRRHQVMHIASLHFW